MQLNLTHISYTYPGTVSPAIEDVSATFPTGWTDIIGDNGCGKSTLARIAARAIAPDSGTVSPNLFASYCEQDSTQEPDMLFDLASDWSKEAQQARALLRIEDDWFWRYDTLSGGRLTKAEAELSKKTVSKRYDHCIGEFGVAARSSCVAHLEASRLSAGEFSIDVPELWISPTDHVVLTGANGTGQCAISVQSGILTGAREALSASFREKAVALLENASPKPFDAEAQAGHAEPLTRTPKGRKIDFYISRNLPLKGGLCQGLIARRRLRSFLGPLRASQNERGRAPAIPTSMSRRPLPGHRLRAA